MTSTTLIEGQVLSKGRQVMKDFLETLPPSQHGEFTLVLQSDKPGLTKVRLTRKITARAREGRPVSEQA